MPDEISPGAECAVTNLVHTAFGQKLTAEAIARFKLQSQEEAVRVNYYRQVADKRPKRKLKARLLNGE